MPEKNTQQKIVTLKELKPQKAFTYFREGNNFLSKIEGYINLKVGNGVVIDGKSYTVIFKTDPIIEADEGLTICYHLTEHISEEDDGF